jgi:signal transduction histidine kinase/CheY-like chemotaxis protein
MAEPASEGLESRVLVLAPTGRDAALARRVLEESGIRAQTCGDLEELRREIQNGAGAVLLTEDALNSRAVEALAEIFRTQLSWSDLALLLFSSSAANAEFFYSPLHRLGAFANVVLLDRPTHKATLISAVRSALRARRRQYEVRDLLFELKQGVRDRDQFLAMLSHELRNPLGVILAAVQLMEQRDTQAFAGEREVILRQTRLVSRLVDDLLDVSRVTSGRISLEREAIDLRDLVSRCVQSQAAVASARGIDLVLSAESPIVTPGDPVRLDQVVNNLLANAVKYTPRGGRVEVRLRREGRIGELRVRDTGVGITPDILPRVFDLFTQAKSTLERSEGGLGIGLTLVRRLVELHGGSAAAESEGPGKGSTFTVRLPIHAAEVARKSSSLVETVPPRRRQILLVEDNPDMRESLKRLLEEVGHDVRAASNGVEGVEVALASSPEIALVDIGIPLLDGYRVARRLRQARGDSILLVALTGYGMPDDRRQALEAGFDAHLTKPITVDAILDLLRRSEAG